MAHRKGGRESSTYEETTGAVPTASRLVAIVSCIAAIGAMVHGLRDARPPTDIATGISPTPAVSGAPPPDLRPSTVESLVPSITPAAAPPLADVPRIGIVSGHWGNDTGAVCPDGLTEAEVNLDVARRVIDKLQALGYQTDLLEEFDPRLEGYRADALVSIHADSCVGGLSGFKVAHHVDADPLGPAARLAAALSREYAAATGLAPHIDTITDDMRRYHALRKIAPDTPGVIIECGFLGGDRELLTEDQGRVAEGIANGVLAFLQAEGSTGH